MLVFNLLDEGEGRASRLDIFHYQVTLYQQLRGRGTMRHGNEATAYPVFCETGFITEVRLSRPRYYIPSYLVLDFGSQTRN